MGPSPKRNHSPIMFIARFIASVCAIVFMSTATLPAAPVKVVHVEVELLAEHQSIQPGTPFLVGLRMKMDEHWHTYWKNSGDSGQPTSINWTLPPGFSAGEIQWPAPSRIRTGHLVSYGYEGEILLLTEITPPADLAPGTRVTLHAATDWLMCKEECIPGEAKLSLELPVQAGTPSPNPAQSERFAAARRALPIKAQSTANFAVNGDDIVLTLPLPSGGNVDTSDVYFYPFENLVVEPARPQIARWENDQLVLRLKKSEIAPTVPGNIAGVLTAKGGFPPLASGQALEIAAERNDAAVAAIGAISAGGGSTRFLPAALLGFMGGLILNLMPCVFPVLGIKILGFVNQAGSDRRKVTTHGLVFTAGVLVSFWVLAGALIALRAGGAQLGWGFQLQSPVFVYALALFLLVFALNLSGLFEFGLSATRVGGSLAMSGGYSGSFFSGVLATVVATPCAAPFLAGALGAALTMPPASSLLLFTIIALGLATPYLVLSAFPSLVRLLPRPGAWMETFRQVMAFPLYATVGYLVWVLAGQVPERGFLYAIFGLVLVGMAAWAYGRWTQHGGAPQRQTFGYALALLLLGSGVALGYPRQPAATDVVWQEWSTEKVDQLRAEGKTIYVDFTARWCATCQVNKSVVFASDEVLDTFRRLDVVALKADWTNKDPAITRALESFGRSAVPFNLIYTPNSPDPIILPEVLRPGIVLDALKSTAEAPRTSAVQTR